MRISLRITGHFHKQNWFAFKGRSISFLWIGWVRPKGSPFFNYSINWLVEPVIAREHVRKRCRYIWPLNFINSRSFDDISRIHQKINILYVILCVKLHIPIFTRILQRLTSFIFENPQIFFDERKDVIWIGRIGRGFGIGEICNTTGKAFLWL